MILFNAYIKLIDPDWKALLQYFAFSWNSLLWFSVKAHCRIG